METAGTGYPWTMPNEPNPRAKDSLRDCGGASGAAAGFCGVGVGGGLMRTSRVPMCTLAPPSELEFLRSLDVLEAGARSLGAFGLKVIGAAGFSRGRESPRVSGLSGGRSLGGGVRLANLSAGVRAAGGAPARGCPSRSIAGTDARDSAATRVGDCESGGSRGPAAADVAGTALPDLSGRSGSSAAEPIGVVRCAPAEFGTVWATAPRAGSDSFTGSTKPLVSAAVGRNITGGGRSVGDPLTPSANRAR